MRELTVGNNLLYCDEGLLESTGPDRLLELVQNPSGEPVLGGRGIATALTLANGQRAVVRPLRRGGFIRHFVRDLYFAIGDPRPVAEAKQLLHLKSSGVPVPAPLAAVVHRSKIFPCYRAWLITAEIPGSQTLQDLAPRLSSGERERLSLEAGKAAVRCLQLGVRHTDLHPGNVLVNERGEVFLLDFDRAAPGRDVREERETLCNRWRRAVIKRGLPDEMTLGFRAGLFGMESV